MSAIEILPTQFKSESEIIRGHFVKPTGQGPFPGICKFHGLPGSSDQVHGIAMSLAEVGFIVLTFDFRGFRESEGIFSLSGEIEDARAAVTHLLDSEWSQKEWVGVYGASFGAAIAICAAALDDRIRSICVRAPVYDTVEFVNSDLAELVLHDIIHTFPDEMHHSRDNSQRADILQHLKKDSMKYNPMIDIEHLSPRSVYITSGDSDRLIDTKGVEQLFDRAREPKEMVMIKGADHNLSNESARRETELGIIKWFDNQVVYHGQ